ncbi:MAG: DUF1320 family protein [Flavobacteriales bacterium]|nr:DUF1320 family protein [Flavobacteriales bacterium]
MIQTVNIPNYNDNNILQQTVLTDDVVAGATNLPVQNTSGFDVGFIAIGTPGAEGTEIRSVSAVASTVALTINALSLSHKQPSMVQRLFGNQVKLYRAPNVDGTQPTDDQFVVVGSPFDIKADSGTTPTEDPTGGSDYWYKYTYYNSVTLEETDLSQSNSARGGGVNNYASLAAIRQEAGFNGARYITDQLIDEKRQAAQSKINGMLVGVYTIPFTAPINPFISDITIRLAAGYLLQSQYKYQSQRKLDADAKVSAALADLKSLATKQVTLTDENGASTSLEGSAGGFSGWPNEDTAGTSRDQGGAGRQFRMGSINGYRERQF